MGQPLPAPTHPDAAARWLAIELARATKPPHEDMPPSKASTGEGWLELRQRLESELARHAARPPR